MAIAALCAAAAGPAAAQDYPARPIRIIVPFPAGASTDTLARAVAQRFTEQWGQPAVVDNRSGASGTIGAAAVARAAPDGYQLLMATTSTHSITPNAMKAVPYDPVKDFAAISLVAWVPNVLVVHPSLPARSVKEFIALARSRPAELLFSSSGSGSFLHLCGEVFRSMAKVDLVHVPYKGAAPALTDLVSGQIHLMFNTVASARPFVQAGRLRPLGVTTPQRSRALPDVPTIAEAALPGYSMSNWVGLLAPAGTSRDVVAKIGTEVGRFARAADNSDRFRALGADLDGGTPEAFAAMIAAEQGKYARIIRDAGVRPE
jgi:tripartite-type tricarboxylate transporter receptor subunit TctC